MVFDGVLLKFFLQRQTNVEKTIVSSIVEGNSIKIEFLMTRKKKEV